MKTNSLRLTREILSHLTALTIAGILIGIFHPNDLVLSICLLILCLTVVVKRLRSNRPQDKIYIAAMVITGCCGVIAEKWGISNSYWEYHNLEGERDFPYWLPFAWALSFAFIYRVERTIIEIHNIKSFKSKLTLASLIAITFPVIGEIITINLGVWTYNWPAQVFGVPVYAILSLVFLHTAINLLMVLICKKMKIKDPVLSA